MKLNEIEKAELPYVCVHARKGTCNVTAKTSYDAVKKAAEKWKLKSTAGIDAHRADVEKIATESQGEWRTVDALIAEIDRIRRHGDYDSIYGFDLDPILDKYRAPQG